MAVKTVLYEASDGAEHAAAVMETAISASMGHRNVVSRSRQGRVRGAAGAALWSSLQRRSSCAHALREQVATYHYDIKRVGEHASDGSQGGAGLQVCPDIKSCPSSVLLAPLACLKLQQDCPREARRDAMGTTGFAWHRSRCCREQVQFFDDSSVQAGAGGTPPVVSTFKVFLIQVRRLTLVVTAAPATSMLLPGAAHGQALLLAAQHHTYHGQRPYPQEVQRCVLLCGLGCPCHV